MSAMMETMLCEQVYGRLMPANATNGQDRFAINLAASNVHRPTGPYSPTGTYMSFQHYDVERRPHLKCISGIEGIS